MATCPVCESEIANDNPALKQAALLQAVESQGGWGRLEGRNVGFIFRAGQYSAKVEAKKLDPGYPANNYDSAYNQGETFDAFIVFDVDGTYFKKGGTGDSYGEIAWDGELKKVVATERVVKVFE